MNNKTTLTRIVLTLLLALFCVSGVWAENITTEQALEQALDFLTGQKATPGKPRKAQGQVPQLQLQGKVSGLYVFNVENEGGFVIVSNDDRTRPILGFSEKGSLDANNIPDNMRAWLQGYADEIAWLQQQPRGSVAVPKTGKVGTHPTTAVAPLVTTTWNQGTPYNNLCPNYSNWYGSSGKCATGCVATAMAQVMNYHKWPKAQTTTIPGYTTATQGLNLSSLPAVTFDWAHMKNSYSGSYTTTEATAVATLMKYCGYSVKMDYDESSGAYTEDVAIALRDYFDYNPYTTRFVSRSSYTYENWTDMIYHEVSHSRPVCYGGLSSGGGHEFVCDGYKFEQNTDFFHINWGWGGMSDNYFVLSALDPDQQGIGGSTSTDGFHYGQDAVIGIQKSTASGTIANIDPNENNLILNSITLSETAVEPNTTVNITFNITNDGDDPYDGDIWLCLREDDDDYLMDLESVVIPGNTTQDVVIPYTPTQTGSYTFLMCYINANGEYIVCESDSATLVVTQNLNNGVVPIYGYWTDQLTKSQFIIAEAIIEDMANSTITSMTFSATQSSVSWGSAKFDVYLSETDDNTINSLKSWSTLEKVYSGSLSVSNKKMTVTFDEPFYYQGGNLLVGFNQTQTGSYSQVAWKGENITGVSVGGYSSSISQQNFRPDTEFEYTPGNSTSLKVPKDLAVHYVGGIEATVSWTSYAPAFDIEVNGEVTENVSNPTTLTGLELATTYTIKVRARDGEEVSNWTEPVSFTTSLSEVTCQISLELSDAMGDGWNGAAIKLVDVLTGTELGTFSCTSEAAKNEVQTYYVEVPDDRDIEFQWVKGSYDHECSYAAYDVRGNLIFSGSKRMKEPVAYHVSCGDPYPAPTNVEATAITTTTAVIVWDSELIKYDLRYRAEEDWIEINDIEATSHELTELTQETTYEVQVRGYCEGAEAPTEWSEAITFTTLGLYNIVLSSYNPENASIIEAHDGKHCNVTLGERTFHRDGYWNTICLPFDLTLEGSPLQGADLRALSQAYVEGDVITLNFTEEGELDAIIAGIPYLIKWPEGETLTEADLVFNDVVIRNVNNDFVTEDGTIQFKGSYSPILFTAEDKNIRFMGGNSVLYYPLNGARIGTQRAYFQFAEGVCHGKQYITNIGEDNPTSIEDLDGLNDLNDAWYDLEGRKLAGKPAQKGIYINGKKTVVVK